MNKYRLRKIDDLVQYIEHNDVTTKYDRTIPKPIQSLIQFEYKKNIAVQRCYKN